MADKTVMTNYFVCNLHPLSAIVNNTKPSGGFTFAIFCIQYGHA
jgi:hypothetical protein